MKKVRLFIIVFIVLLCCYVACVGGTEGTSTSSSNSSKEDTVKKTTDGKVAMPYGSASYCGADWTLESLKAHLIDLGFTNIVEYPEEPWDENCADNIFFVKIRRGWSKVSEWEAGEEFETDEEVIIRYNKAPMLTVENCPDLLTVLTSDEMSYTEFAEKYDGRYVEIDGYISSYISKEWETSRVIEMRYGNQRGENLEGAEVHLGDVNWGSKIDKDIVEGELVHIRGKIDFSDTEFFQRLHVNCILYEKR